MSLRTTAETIGALIVVVGALLAVAAWVDARDVAAETRAKAYTDQAESRNIAALAGMEKRLAVALSEIVGSLKDHQSQPAHVGAVTNEQLGSEVTAIRNDISQIRSEIRTQGKLQSEAIGMLKALTK